MPELDENNPEAREERVEMYAARSMRFAEPGDPCRSIAIGEKFVTQRKNVRWLEHSRKAYRDKKKAVEVSRVIAAEFVGEIQKPSAAPHDDSAPGAQVSAG